MYSGRNVTGVFVLGLLLNSVIIAHTIRCYQCNSITDPECGDISKHRPNEVNHFLKECDNSHKKLHAFCRTIDLTVLNNNKLSIVRTCGWDLSQHQCYQGDNRMERESVCQCFSDACNGSTRIWTKFWLMGSCVFSMAFLFKYIVFL